MPERPPPLPQAAAELWDLVVAYLKQETAVPLQQLARAVGFGLLSSLLLGFGVVCVTVGGLRVLQEETGETFTGDWSWAPYGIMTVALLLIGGIIWKVGTRRKKRKPYAMSELESKSLEPKSLKSDDPISKADIQAKFAELKGGVDAEVANVRGIAIGVGVAVVVVAVLVTFALGRRRGRRLATIVEIRRV